MYAVMKDAAAPAADYRQGLRPLVLAPQQKGNKLPMRLVQNLSGAVDGVAVDVVQEPPEGRAHILIRKRPRRELL